MVSASNIPRYLQVSLLLSILIGQFYSFCYLSFTFFYYKHGIFFYPKFHSYFQTADSNSLYKSFWFFFYDKYHNIIHMYEVVSGGAHGVIVIIFISLMYCGLLCPAARMRSGEVSAMLLLLLFYNKKWMRLFVFHIVQILFGKIYIQLFSFQRWIYIWADWTL